MKKNSTLSCCMVSFNFKKKNDVLLRAAVVWLQTETWLDVSRMKTALFACMQLWSVASWKTIEYVDQTGSGFCHIIDLYIYVCLQLWLSLEMNFLFKLKQERFWIESLKLILCFTDAPSLWFRVNIDLLHSLQDYLCPLENFERQCTDLI